MTAFALTGEQQDFAERVRQIAADQLRPLAEAGTPGRVNRPLIKAMGDLGLLARLFPGLGDGSPLSREAAALDLCLLREALARQSTEAETALALQGLGSYPVLQSGQEEVVRRWLPAVAALRRGHLLEHLYREVRAPRIYEGASEVQRTIIARELYR